MQEPNRADHARSVPLLSMRGLYALFIIPVENGPSAMDPPLMTTTSRCPAILPEGATLPQAAALVQALSESRERWRALVSLGADLGFETDAEGRFSILAPRTVLGWPVEHLIGTPAEALLAPGGGG